MSAAGWCTPGDTGEIPLFLYGCRIRTCSNSRSNRVAGGSQGGSIRSIEKARKENERNKIKHRLYIYRL